MQQAHPDDADTDEGAALARACAAAMAVDDEAVRARGIEVVDVGPGRAVARMTVDEVVVNGHGTAHGGYVFLLADTAFGYACNSRGPRAVAAGCDIDFTAPARLGDALTATAVERWRAGRSGLYDVTVRRGDGTVVAEMRGRSRTVGGSWVEGAPAT